MKDILKSEKRIKDNIGLLVGDYKKKTGRSVCLSCPSDVQYMILTLKNIYKMVQFRFKKENAQYKNKKGDKTTISNNTMTDEKAVEFLKANPERISLFLVYPENWKDLIEVGAEIEMTDAEKEAFEVSSGSQLNIVDESKKVEADIEVEAKVKAEIKSGCEGNVEKLPTLECLKKKRAELEEMKLKDLRVSYPEIKEVSVKAFVELVILQDLQRGYPNVREATSREFVEFLNK